MKMLYSSLHKTLADSILRFRILKRLTFSKFLAKSIFRKWSSGGHTASTLERIFARDIPVLFQWLHCFKVKPGSESYTAPITKP